MLIKPCKYVIIVDTNTSNIIDNLLYNVINMSKNALAINKIASKGNAVESDSSDE